MNAKSQDGDAVEVTDGRKHPFFVVDNDLIAIYGPKIGAYGIAVYNVLAYYANKKDQAWPSYQTIADHLGISRPKVVTTINALIECGLISKEHRYSSSGDKTSNSYTLSDIHETGSKQDLPRSKRHLPPSQPNLPQGDKPDLPRGKRRVHEQDPLNKTHSFEQDPLNNKDATRPAEQEKTLTSQQAMFGAICEAVGWDHHTLSEKSKGQVAQTVGVLIKAKYTVEDIRRFMVDIWFNDWRWLKQEQRPTLNQIREEIGKLRAGVPENIPRAKEKGVDGYRAMLARQGIDL